MKLEILYKNENLDIDRQELYIIEYNNNVTIGVLFYGGIDDIILYYHNDNNIFYKLNYTLFKDNGGKFIKKVSKITVE